MKHPVPFCSPLLAMAFSLSVLTFPAFAEDDLGPAAVLRAYAESEAAETASPAPADVAPLPAQTSAPVVQGADSARARLMPLIEKTAQDHALPPALLDAVVRVESRYNPQARNAGAIGLMQIKLATARGLGFGGDAAGLSKPETNLYWGAKYLSRAYQLSGGDTCLTLARYQGGHRVAKLGPAGKAYCAKVRTVLAQLN